MKDTKETIETLEDNQIKIGWLEAAMKLKWIELQLDQTQTDMMDALTFALRARTA